jgi:ABC-type transport system involved in multi-copper enzyme maturation permease subunit
MSTLTPYRSPAREGRDGFGQLLHAEWTKFRTVRGWVIGMILAIAVSAGIGIFVSAGFASQTCEAIGGPGNHGAACASGTQVVGPGGEPVTDNFYFVRQPLAGHGGLTVRVTSLASLLPPAGQVFGTTPSRPGVVPWSKAGIIIKASLSPGSAYAAIMATGGNGVRMQWDYTGDTPGLPGAVSAASPRWLRLTRDGDTITGSDSADGIHWAVVGVVRLAGLESTVQAGLFTASPTLAAKAVNMAGVSQGGGGFTATAAVFDHLSRSGAWPASTWTGGYTEGDLAAEAQGIGGYHQAAGRITVTGQGDIAPVIPDQGTPGGPSKGTVATYLIGTFLGLIVVAVVATMFMTAEYRRGLIRTTLTASPRRGRVLAAKALVVGAVAFVAGLLGAVAAVTLATAIAHSQGYSVFPTPWPTEVRMIVGTGALVAVAAVLTLAVAATVCRSVGAVTIVIAAIVVPTFLSTVVILPVGVADWLLRVTPAAGFAVQQATPQYPQVSAYYAPVSGFYPLAPWAGFAVLCAWTVIAFAAAAYLLRRRDA